MDSPEPEDVQAFFERFGPVTVEEDPDFPIEVPTPEADDSPMHWFLESVPGLETRTVAPINEKARAPPAAAAPAAAAAGAQQWWTLEENRLLKESVALQRDRHGRPQWKAIADCIPGRTAQECRCRWRRVESARILTLAGQVGKNICKKCKVPRRGHDCPFIIR